jgi:large subunit ribosomal protein L18
VITKSSKEENRRKRHVRVRRKVSGTESRPRLSIRRSLKHVYAQVIDDERGHTLVAASSLEKELRSAVEGLCMTEKARKVGELLGQRAKENGIERVVFDRGGYKYHGKVAALADGARSSGLEL